LYEIWDVALAVFDIFQIFLIIYVAVLCIFYLILFLMAFTRLSREKGLHKIEPYKLMNKSAFTPPISILVPAYNEENGIVPTVLSLITGNGKLDYPEYEVIVINDGSTDSTLHNVISRFQMVQIGNKVLEKRNGIDTNPIKAVYQSGVYPNLFLIDKINGGKSDALNAGVNLSKYPYFASIDGDTILESDSILKIMKPIIENPEQEILASGGNVMIANGSKIVQGRIQEYSLSSKPIVIMQSIEYMRAFLMGRIGLSRGNLLLIISGAFGVFNTQKVIQIGGYKTDTIGEDMELVVRLQRCNIEKEWGARIIYVADPVCYTEAPETMKFLRNQRIRWHRGLMESLWAHKRMMLNPRYGSIGMVAMPFFFLFELMAPVIELLGYIFILIGFILGNVYIPNSFSLFILMVIYGSVLSMGAVLLGEWRLQKYEKISDMNKLFFFALTESFWFRPVLTIWRVWAMLSVLVGKKQKWGENKRIGVSA
jgi:cellulose synthase/poly-beta-1,6-N-acetylglucosamine synthase-like glycosyltransferase